MWVVRDLSGGPKPSPLNLFYNGDYEIDSTTKRYKGSLVKVTDTANAEGMFLTWAGDSTQYQSIFGILEEEQGITGNYLPSDALYGMKTRKITPILPSSIVRGEYAQTDPSGTAILDNGCVIAAASATVALTLTASATHFAGGWFYFVTGANAGYLHYIEQNTTSAATLGTACVNAVATGDTYIAIAPANCTHMDLCAHEVCLKSEVLYGSRLFRVLGLMHYLTDDGIPFQRLDRDKHDGLKLRNPRFYHDFIVGGSATVGSVWRDVIVEE